MDEKYDYIVLGTGLKECILSGLLSIQSKKVLHIDRNDYYGGESTSFSPIEKLFEFFKKPFEDKFGDKRAWNVDLIPKFLMGDGKLVKLLVKSGVTRYVQFKAIEGSYVYIDGVVRKVPANQIEAVQSPIMGLFEKRRFKNFLSWAVELDLTQPKVIESFGDKTIECFYKNFNLEPNTKDFIGHAICLYQDDSYMQNEKAIDVVRKVQLYSNSLARFEKSPYLYPLYGLGELPQSFARLSAVYGGTYMLNKPDAEIVFENGKVVGVKSEGEIAKCDKIICDPSYALDKCKVVGKVVRCICILKKPIVPNIKSCQLIIPQKQIGRKHDIYVTMCSYDNYVCAKDFYLALIATTVENENGNPNDEIAAGLKIIQKDNTIIESFMHVVDLYEPVVDSKETNLFISKSYDATTHFETTCEDVVRLYEQATGEKFDFSKMTSLNLEEQ